MIPGAVVPRPQAREWSGHFMPLHFIPVMNKRLPLIFRHILYNLRGGFLLRPLAIALALGTLGAGLSWLEEFYPAFSAWVPRFLFPTRADPVVAQVILAAIATSIMTVVSIVFAILLMTLTLASMQFSPRIIVDGCDHERMSDQLHLLHERLSSLQKLGSDPGGIAIR